MDLIDNGKELKYKFAREIQYEGKGTYYYRNTVINVHNTIIYLHYTSKDNYTRNVRNEYSFSIKDNNFTHEQLVTIFTNIDYILGVIKKRILKLFEDDSYDGAQESFEAKFDKKTNIFTISIEYQLQDEVQPNHKNKMVCEDIINTILDAAEELKEDNSTVNLKVVNGDVTVIDTLNNLSITL